MPFERHFETAFETVPETAPEMAAETPPNESELELESVLESESGGGGAPGGGGPPLPAKRSRDPTPVSRVWRAYGAAYEGQYGHKPTWNAKQGGLCSQLVKRLGVEDAIKVVEFYVRHRKAYYVQKVHQLEACVGDCEGLKTQMLAGHQMTASQAQEVDRNAGTAQAFAATAARLERERLERERKAGGDP
jgi:hypothetical protein